MKILIKYLKPYKWLVGLVMFLTTINIGFSLLDPIIFGKLVNLGSYHQKVEPLSWNDFLFTQKDYTDTGVKMDAAGVIKKTENTKTIYGVVWLLIASISVAMISRIAKAFQDYFLSLITQKFGATIFTQGVTTCYEAALPGV